MHDLSLLDELGGRTVVVVVPEGFGLQERLDLDISVPRMQAYAVANIAARMLESTLRHWARKNLLDGHQSQPRQKRHGEEQLPELDLGEHC